MTLLFLVEMLLSRIIDNDSLHSITNLHERVVMDNNGHTLFVTDCRTDPLKEMLSHLKTKLRNEWNCLFRERAK